MDAHDLPASALTTYLRDGAWLSALARHLVRDPAAADDLAQDTWLAFLRRGPATESARPWLATVLRNAARERHRSTANRAARERTAAREQTPDASAADAVERAELRRVVFDEVLALDEPFRSTVLLRYAEGQSSAAIARAQHVPEGTVRWRLKEGLDRLRARLDAKHDGNRDAWVAWLAPLAEPATRVASGLALVAAAAFVLVLTTAVFVWRAATDADASDVASAAVDPAPPVAAAAAPNSEPAPIVAAPLREDTPPSTARIAVRVLDEASRPVEGATVRIESSATTAAAAAPPRVTTDRDGRAELAWPLAQPAFVDVVVERRGFERASHRASIAPDATVALGDVVLVPGIEVSGVVVDADGNPVADAEVFALSHALHGAFDKPTERDDPRERSIMGQSTTPFDVARLPSTRTDATGRFALDGLPLDGYSIFAHATGRAFTRAMIDLGDAAARADVKLMLTPAKSSGGRAMATGTIVESGGRRVQSTAITFDLERVVRVRVTSTRGLSVADAKLLVLDAAKQHMPCPTQRDTDAQGIAFLVPHADAPIHFSVIASLHRTRLVGPIEPTDTRASIDVALEPEALVAGVVMHDGTPVAGARVALAFDDDLKVDRGFSSRAFTDFTGVTQTDAQGRFALGRAHDMSRAWLTVRHERIGVRRLAPADFAARSDLDALTLELAPGGALEVRVPVAKGTPPAGYVVGVHDALGSLFCARTDTDGIARFPHLAPGVVHVARLGREEDPYEGVGEGKRRLDARVTPTQDVAIVADKVATLVLEGAGTRSRVVGRVTLDGAAATGAAQRYANDIARVARASLVDGAFALTAPAAGPGRVVMRIERANASFAVTVAKTWSGGDERIDLELRTATLKGRVLAPRKERSRLAWLWKGPGGATCEERIRVADDGTFALDAILAGDAELRARDEVLATFTVAPGETKSIDVP